MGVTVALLRAINLGKNRKFPKESIVLATESAGFVEVATHINTGNVRFGTTLRSRARIEAALEAAYLADRGFEVPAITFTAAEFAAVADEAAALRADRPDLARHYVYFLKDELTPEVAATVEEAGNEHGEMVVRGRAVHALLGPSYQPGVVDPLNAAKHLGVATSRAHTVVHAIAEKWCR